MRIPDVESDAAEMDPGKAASATVNSSTRMEALSPAIRAILRLVKDFLRSSSGPWLACDKQPRMQQSAAESMTFSKQPLTDD